MANKLSVPDNLKPMFEQMMRMAPDELCEDEQFQKSTLVYLKLGGAKLARQHIKVRSTPFCSGFEIVKPPSAEINTAVLNKEEKNEKYELTPEVIIMLCPINFLSTQ